MAPARGVLILDHPNAALQTALRQHNYLVHVLPSNGDEQLGLWVSQRVLVTDRPEAYREAAAIHEFSNRCEIFNSLQEVRVLTERWRVYFNTERPHSSLGYRPPAPEARLTKNMGHGEVEIATRFPLLHTPDGGYLKSKTAALH